VTLAGGRVDTFIYSLDPDAELRVGDIEFSGSFGYWSQQDGEPRCAHLVNGRYLRAGDEEVALDPPRIEAAVTEVDLAERTLTLDRDLPADLDLEGRMAYVQGGPHRTAYHVAEVLAPNTLRLDLSSLRFRSKIEGFAQDGTHVEAELPPSIEAARGFPPGHYDGALITDETLQARYRVDHVVDTKVFPDEPFEPSNFTDADGDGRAVFLIYDHGPGDTVTIRRNVFRRWE
jgi:hypothetical protein